MTVEPVEYLELLRDLRESEYEFETVWKGDSWREGPQPVVAVPGAIVVSVVARVRDYLESNPEAWLTAREIRTAICASYDETTDRLYRLVGQGQVERRKGPEDAWLYRWVSRETAREARRLVAKPRELHLCPKPRRPRHSQAQWAAMRARLERAS